ncbi:hypothetical protein EYF80_035208 [Liparis tanakae]|uniref:Uncharacterized protein n=1 Tax=Liparis tanakae TaxID=230148 RepID=A0A4Z2GLU4_9TELE|nr:hypothetical protein EYF80_035208 [Liparis tanakae]
MIEVVALFYGYRGTLRTISLLCRVPLMRIISAIFSSSSLFSFSISNFCSSSCNGLCALMFCVSATHRLQLHAQLFIFHKSVLLLCTLIFQFCLQTVDLGLQLCDVTLSLQEGRREICMLGTIYSKFCALQDFVGDFQDLVQHVAELPAEDGAVGQREAQSVGPEGISEVLMALLMLLS